MSPALQADFLPSEPRGKPKNTGVGSLSLLQGNFPTQELNWGLLHCRQILYQLSYQGSPYWPWTGEFSFQSQRRAVPKNVQTTQQLHSFCILVRLCSKSFKLGFSSMWNETQMYQLGFKKGRGTRDQIANIRWIIEKAREFQKNICFIDYTKGFDWITTNCGKFFKRWKYHTTLPVSWEICMWVKKQQLEHYMEQLTGSNLGKE